MVFDATAERKNELKGILDDINTTLRDISKAQPHFPQVSLSFGVAEKTCDMTFEVVYRLADQALYSVKKAGGCGVAFDAGFQGK
jgi:GGDEF domain-containing protein